MDKYSYISNADVGYVDQLYQNYKKDPASVDITWQKFFEGYDFSTQRYGENGGPAPTSGVDTPEDAQRVAKSSLYLPKSSRPKSGRGEFYDDEVIGFDVVDSSLGALGKITEIVAAGPNKLLSVSHNEKEVLIPLNSPFIDGVNKSRKKISVTLPDGYLEI